MSGQRRDGRGRFAEGSGRAVVPTALEVRSGFIPTLEKSEQARTTGMRGLYRLFVERAVEILQEEVKRGGDENLDEALSTVRAIRSRQAVSGAEKEAARLTLKLYSGDSEPVAQSAGILLGVFRRSERKTRR